MTVLIITICAAALIMLIYIFRSKSPVRTALKSMLSGAAVLILVYFFGDLIHIKLELTFFNTAVSLILGIPGVGLLILSKFIVV